MNEIPMLVGLHRGKGERVKQAAFDFLFVFSFGLVDEPA